MRTSLLGLSLLTALAVGGCSGDSGDSGDTGDSGAPAATAGAACSAGDGRALQALSDDRAALPADNWLPVLATREDFRDTLALLDQASRSFSGEDLQAVVDAGATGDAGRDAALAQAVSDVPEGQAGAGVVRLTVADDTTARAVGAYYRAALERLGARVTLERADDLAATLDALPRDDRAAAPVVLSGLSDLAGQVGAELPAGGDASAQVQAVATAALERELVLGSTAAAGGTAQVLVPDALVSAEGLVTISDLAEACGDAVLAVAGEGQGAAEAVAEAYGLRVGPQVEAPADAFAGGAVAVLTAGS